MPIRQGQHGGQARLAKDKVSLLFLFLFAFGPTSPVGASAQLSRESEYRSLIEDAVGEYKLGHWDEAHALFEQAHAVNPNARTLRGLGMVAFEARDYVSCLAYLRQALDDNRKPLTEQQRSAAEKLISRASKFVGRFQIRLVPSNASLTVGGYSVELRNGELLLNMGEHDLTAKAPGYRELRKRLIVQGGRRGVLELLLDPLSDSEEDADGQPARTTTPASLESGSAQESAPSLVPYIVMGGGGAVLLTSAITGALTASARSELDDGCDQEGHCYRDLESTKERGEALKLATNILLATGAVITATGLALLFLLPPEANKADELQALLINCSANGCMGLLNTAF